MSEIDPFRDALIAAERRVRTSSDRSSQTGSVRRGGDEARPRPSRDRVGSIVACVLVVAWWVGLFAIALFHTQVDWLFNAAGSPLGILVILAVVAALLRTPVRRRLRIRRAQRRTRPRRRRHVSWARALGEEAGLAPDLTHLTAGRNELPRGRRY